MSLFFISVNIKVQCFPSRHITTAWNWTICLYLCWARLAPQAIQTHEATYPVIICYFKSSFCTYHCFSLGAVKGIWHFNSKEVLMQICLGKNFVKTSYDRFILVIIWSSLFSFRRGQERQIFQNSFTNSHFIGMNKTRWEITCNMK